MYSMYWWPRGSSYMGAENGTHYICIVHPLIPGGVASCKLSTVTGLNTFTLIVCAAGRERTQLINCIWNLRIYMLYLWWYCGWIANKDYVTSYDMFEFTDFFLAMLAALLWMVFTARTVVKLCMHWPSGWTLLTLVLLLWCHLEVDIFVTFMKCLHDYWMVWHEVWYGQH